MGHYHDKSFPGESQAYRDKRDELIEAEIALRRQTEAVAAMRRALPLGGELKSDYEFDAASGGTVRFSDLFDAGNDSLLIYSFMYGLEAEKPCPACTSVLDALNGGATHLKSRINLAVVARASAETLKAWAEKRGWGNLRLLSSENNTYNVDYFAETEEGNQIPAVNIFSKSPEGIHHTYNTELLYSPCDEGQNPRHVDSFWPLWSVFDLTPGGRGTDWFPSLSYD